jgi:hypothetical protein
MGGDTVGQHGLDLDGGEAATKGKRRRRRPERREKAGLPFVYWWRRDKPWAAGHVFTEPNGLHPTARHQCDTHLLPLASSSSSFFFVKYR